MNWFVLYTKSNFEIRVSKGLNDIGIKAYCPTYKRVIQYTDRKKKVEKPLLPSYVLVYLSEQERNRVFEIPGVVRYVFWLGKPAIVRALEVEALRDSLSNVIKSISVKQLKKGVDYLIPEGPLKGHQGTVIDHVKNKLKLQLSGLGIFVTLTLA